MHTNGEEMNAETQRPQRIAEGNWLRTTHSLVIVSQQKFSAPLRVAAFVPAQFNCMDSPYFFPE